MRQELPGMILGCVHTCMAAASLFPTVEEEEEGEESYGIYDLKRCAELELVVEPRNS